MAAGRGRRQLRLRLRLTGTLAVLALLPFAAPAFFIWHSSEQRVRDNARVHMRSDLVLAQSELSEQLDAAELRSQQAALSPALHQALYGYRHGSRPAATRFLKRFAVAQHVLVRVDGRVVAGTPAAQLAALSRQTVVAGADATLGTVIAAPGTPAQLLRKLEHAADLQPGEWFGWERGRVTGRPIAANVLRFQAAPGVVLAIHGSAPALAAALRNERLLIGGSAAAAVIALLTLAFLLARPLLARIGEMQRAAQESLVDELTGIANRRSVRRSLRAELDRAARHAESVSVILCDLDGFKQVNDHYGHETGDRVLQAFAGVAQSQLRSHDHVGRYGGEEFLLVLPETCTYDAVNAAERLRAAFEDELVDGVQGRLTASFGVASFPEETDPDALLRAADRALYQAKASGRNCVRSSASARPARPRPERARLAS